MRQLKISQFKSLIVALVVNKIVFLKYLFVIKFITENHIQLNYNPEARFCNWPKDVDCGNRPICDGNDQNCHNDSMSTPKPKEPCESMGKCSSNETDKFQPQGSCNTCYCQCANQRYLEFCCPACLVFNSRTNTCDWQSETPGC